jgi:hypothetical protein
LAGLAAYPTNTKPEIEKAESGQLRLRFSVETRDSEADDPFHKWLRDDVPVRIGWSTFGIEKLHSESPC